MSVAAHRPSHTSLARVSSWKVMIVEDSPEVAALHRRLVDDTAGFRTGGRPLARRTAHRDRVGADVAGGRLARRSYLQGGRVFLVRDHGSSLMDSS